MVYKQGVHVPKNVMKVIFHASVTEIPDPDGGNNQGIFSHCTKKGGCEALFS